MNLRQQLGWLIFLFLNWSGASPSVLAQDTRFLPLEPPPPPSALEQLEAELDYSELTRGPVHEAFAEQVNLNPKPGIIVAKEPPPAIEELPPDNKPDGEGVFWADGYWGWNEDDFVWVSGGWRIAPRGYQWVPGYWAKVEAGFQWIGGFWATTERDEVTYLPAPPESLEEGPTSIAPGDNYFWNPGCWYYQNSRYLWRPGYWALAQTDYVWVPHYYRWTPRGCVLAGGYWDFPLASRGCLFAPLAFHRPVYLNRSWRCTPRVTVDLSPLHFHLFVRPDYCHYYFGDYYADRFANSGWIAWHSYYERRRCYDPLFTFNVVRYRRHGVDFHDRLRRWNHYFHEHRDVRPPHTFKQQKELIARHRHQHDQRDLLKTVSLGGSFSDVVRDRREKFVRLDDKSRAQLRDVQERARLIRQQRGRLEMAKRPASEVSQRGEAGVAPSRSPKLKLPHREQLQRSFRDVSERAKLAGSTALDRKSAANAGDRQPRSRSEIAAARRSIATESTDNSGRKQDQATAGTGRSSNPREQPRPDLSSEMRKRLEQRLQQARQQQQAGRQSRTNAAPRIESSKENVDRQPQAKPSSGAERVREMLRRNSQRVEARSNTQSNAPPSRTTTAPSSLQSRIEQARQRSNSQSQRVAPQQSSVRSRTPTIKPQPAFTRRSPSSSPRPEVRSSESSGTRQPTRSIRQPANSTPTIRSNRGSIQSTPSVGQRMKAFQQRIESSRSRSGNSSASAVRRSTSPPSSNLRSNASRGRSNSSRAFGRIHSSSGRSERGRKRD